MRTTRHLLIGIFLISMGALALEVVLTRIFSVTMWYHFAFLAISMALMGSATAGVFIYFFPRLSQRENAQKWIDRAAVALAVTVPIVFLVYLRIPFRPVLMNRDGAFSIEQLGWLALIYVLLSIPFFLSGSGPGHGAVDPHRLSADAGRGHIRLHDGGAAVLQHSEANKRGNGIGRPDFAERPGWARL